MENTMMLKIVFDLDSTLNNLNEYVFAHIVNYPLKKLKVYNVNHNGLTKEQVKKAYTAYKNPETFKRLTLLYGAEEMNNLIKKPNVKVYIHSLSFNEEVGQVKIEWIKKMFPDFDTNKIILVYGESKDMIDDAYVQVEDCLENLLNSKAKVKILINKPYNRADDLPKDIIRVKSPKEAFKIIESLTY